MFECLILEWKARQPRYPQKIVAAWLLLNSLQVALKLAGDAVSSRAARERAQVASAPWNGVIRRSVAETALHCLALSDSFVISTSASKHGAVTRCCVVIICSYQVNGCILSGRNIAERKSHNTISYDTIKIDSMLPFGLVHDFHATWMIAKRGLMCFVNTRLRQFRFAHSNPHCDPSRTPSEPASNSLSLHSLTCSPPSYSSHPSTNTPTPQAGTPHPPPRSPVQGPGTSAPPS